MEKYLLTTPKIEGEITFGYNRAGYLVLFNMPENLDENTTRALLTHLPKTIQKLNEITTGQGVQIQKVPEDLTFDRFWSQYAKKINKLRTEPLFNKLKEADKLLAIIRIPDYKDACYRLKRGVKDPENYIRERYFDTDWKKEK